MLVIYISLPTQVPALFGAKGALHSVQPPSSLGHFAQLVESVQAGTEHQCSRMLNTCNCCVTFAVY